MSFLFSTLAIEIEEQINKNVSYRKNMNKVINVIKESGEEVIDTYMNVYEYTEEELKWEGYQEEMFCTFIQYLDIYWRSVD